MKTQRPLNRTDSRSALTRELLCGLEDLGRNLGGIAQRAIDDFTRGVLHAERGVESEVLTAAILGKPGPEPANIPRRVIEELVENIFRCNIEPSDKITERMNCVIVITELIVARFSTDVYRDLVAEGDRQGSPFWHGCLFGTFRGLNKREWPQWDDTYRITRIGEILGRGVVDLMGESVFSLPKQIAGQLSDEMSACFKKAGGNPFFSHAFLARFKFTGGPVSTYPKGFRRDLWNEVAMKVFASLEPQRKIAILEKGELLAMFQTLPSSATMPTPPLNSDEEARKTMVD